MINKGELYMGYENIDEATRREACEKLKQIVKAIKSLRIKYYINFSKISEKDQQIYERLEKNLEKISTQYDLDGLKVALMEEEINRYYGDKDEERGNDYKDDPNNSESNLKQQKIYNRCCGAVKAEQVALGKGKIVTAKQCKDIWKKYFEMLEEKSYKEAALEYKRGQFEELAEQRATTEERIKRIKQNGKQFWECYYPKEKDYTKKMLKRMMEEKIRNNHQKKQVTR